MSYRLNTGLTRAASLFFILGAFVRAALCQYDTPGTWSLDDLSKLDQRCVSCWKVELDKKGRPGKDSTLSYTFCYDKDVSMLSSVQWDLIQLESGKLDAARIIEFLGRVNDRVEERNSVERVRNLIELLDTNVITITARRSEHTDEGILRYRSYLQFLDTCPSSDVRKPLTEPYNWRIDTATFDQGLIQREITRSSPCIGCPIRTDSIRYFYDNDEREWTRSVQYLTNRADEISWRTFTDGKLTHRVDSSYWLTYDSIPRKRPMLEENHRYDGELRVEEEIINWRGAFDGWPIGPIDKPSRPPVHSIKRFAYTKGELQSIQFITERAGVLDTVVHEHGGIDPLERINNERVVKRTLTGLPLVIVGERLIILRPYHDRPRSEVHFHYSNDWPKGVKAPDDLKRYLEFSPKL